MPTILSIDGYRLFFYSADYNEPIHVHVEHGDGKAKYWIRPIQLASSYKLNSAQLKKIQEILKMNRILIEEKWHEFFSEKK